MKIRASALLMGLLCISICTGNAQAKAEALIPVSGSISDGETGDVLPFAHISVPGSIYGSACDEDGTFTLHLPEGEYELVASYVGYEGQTQFVNVRPGEMTPCHFTLFPVSTLSSEVIVTAAQRSQAIHLAPASLGIVTANDLSDQRA